MKENNLYESLAVNQLYRVRGDFLQNKIIFLASFLISVLILASCSEKTENNSSKENVVFQDDKMIGFVETVNVEMKYIIMDINDWMYRDIPKDAAVATNYTLKVKIDNNTVLLREDGSKAEFQTLKDGQKILVKPPTEKEGNVIATEIVLLELTYNDKFKHFLSKHPNNYRIVMIYDKDNPLPYEFESMIRKINQDTTANFHEYKEDYAVDYKKEFDIKNFPVILIFDTEKLLYKTYDEEEALGFFNRMDK